MSLPPLVEPAESLSVDEVRRYSRHLIIPEDCHGRAEAAQAPPRCWCVGAGGLGSPALDVPRPPPVSAPWASSNSMWSTSRNLQRQIIHGQSDVGRSKAESAGIRCGEINPFVTVNLYEERLDSSNVMELVRPVRPDHRRDRQLGYALLGERRLRPAPQALRVGVRSTASTVKRPCSGPMRARAIAACCRSRRRPAWCLRRRGWCPRCAVRVYRLHPGQRGNQADHRDR